MQLQLVLARIEPTVFDLPATCPKPACDGNDFRLHQQVTKAIRDTTHSTLQIHRYQCLCCGHTFRVYPRGVSHAHTSRRVQELAVMLYLLGLSYGDASQALDAFGVYLAKSRVYDAVRSACQRRPHLKRSAVFDDVQRHCLDRGVIQVRCLNHWISVSLINGEDCGVALRVGRLTPGEITTLRDRLMPLITTLGGYVTLVDSLSRDDRPHPGHDVL